MKQTQSGVFSPVVGTVSPFSLTAGCLTKEVKDRGQLPLVILTLAWQFLSCVHFGSDVSGGTNFDSTYSRPAKRNIIR